MIVYFLNNYYLKFSNCELRNKSQCDSTKEAKKVQRSLRREDRLSHLVHLLRDHCLKHNEPERVRNLYVKKEKEKKRNKIHP